MTKYCKKSKTIMVVSFVLAAILLFVGIIVEVSDTEKPLYDGRIENISSGMQYSKNSTSEVMYKFTPSSSGNYNLSITVEDTCEYYILYENSAEAIEIKNYLVKGQIASNALTPKKHYLGSGTDYYIYIKTLTGTSTHMQLKVSKAN